MIPKVIHYCWFGRGEMPKLALVCIDSWKKYLPDYELKLWNEDNFDITCNPYVKEAYEARKFAFVTDYVRLYVLYEEGGIYMDTDVEILKSLGDLLYLPAFCGFESNKYSNVQTGFMASAPKGIWVKEQMDYYKNKHFINSDGTNDITTNAQTISDTMTGNGFKLNGEYQVYKDDMHCFPKDYFCPKTSTGVIKLTENTYCIHHFSASWKDRSLLLRLKLFILRKLLNPKFSDKLIQLKRRITN